MPGELLLINPRARRRRSTKRRAPRRMSALQRKYFGKRRRSRSRVTRVRRNPRRYRYRSHSVLSRRTRSPYRRRITRARRNPGRVRRYAARARGVMGGAMGFAKDKLLPGAIGGAGALAVDLAWPYVTPYAPAILTSGPLVPVTRIALAIAIGYAGRMVGGKKFGDEVMNGAIIVTLYDVLKGYAVAAEPSIFGTPAASQSPTAQVTYSNGNNCCCDGTMSAYVDGVGWTSPAAQVGMSFRR